jgi:hypothetical protein
VKDFLLSTVSRPVVGLTQSPIKWSPGALSLGAKRRDKEYVGVYINSPIRLHDVVLNYVIIYATLV